MFSWAMVNESARGVTGRNNRQRDTTPGCVTVITGCVVVRRFRCDINGLWAESEKRFEHFIDA
jgi:hypothetical protein